MEKLFFLFFKIFRIVERIFKIAGMLFQQLVLIKNELLYDDKFSRKKYMISCYFPLILLIRMEISHSSHHATEELFFSTSLVLTKLSMSFTSKT